MPNQNGRSHSHDSPRERDDDRADERGWSQAGDEFSERDRAMYARGEDHGRRSMTGYGYDDGTDSERLGYYGKNYGYRGEPRYRDRPAHDLGWQRGIGGHGYGGYALRGPHYGKGPANFQRSDERIREQVNEALTDHDDVDATDIEVQVKTGEVYLTGTVEDRRMKRLAEDCVERVAGVRDVHNQLKIAGRAQQGTENDKKHRAS